MNDVSSPENSTVLAGIHTCLVYIVIIATRAMLNILG